VFEAKILRQLLDCELPNVLCVDRNIALADEEMKVIVDDRMRVVEIGKSVDPNIALGESIGIEKISAASGRQLFAELTQMMESPAHAQDYYEAAYERLLHNGMPFHAIDITGLNWTEIDTSDDFAAANAKFRLPITTVSRGQQFAIDEATTKTPHSA
jgi:choline kinase